MKEEILKALESVVDNNDNWYKSKRQGSDAFDIGKSLPLMAEAVAKIIAVQNNVSDSLPSDKEIELDDIVAWADGVCGALGTEYADRVTKEEAEMAMIIMNEKKRGNDR